MKAGRKAEETSVKRGLREYRKVCEFLSSNVIRELLNEHLCY
jgi:hypothetical protein